MKKKKEKSYEIPPTNGDSLMASDKMTHYQSSSFNPVLLTFAKKPSEVSQIVPKGAGSLISLIKSGITRKSLDDLIFATGLTLSEMADCMHLSERTLRNYTPSTHLGPDPSERAIEIALLYERGKEVFGTLDSFKKYMDTTVLALSNSKPKSFLDTSVGINFLMEELGRIQQGIFS